MSDGNTTPSTGHETVSAGVKRPRDEMENGPEAALKEENIDSTQAALTSEGPVEEDEEHNFETKQEDGDEDGESAQQELENADEDNDENGNDNDNENDEEDDDEDEDEDDDDDVSRRKRRRANQFLDIEAEVDDEEEDELDEDDEEAELLREQFISDDHAEKETGGHGLEDDRLHRQYDQRRQQAEDQDAEELAETLKQRYRKTHTVYRGETTASGTVSQKLLMPSINDPAIFAIRCTPGREKDLVRRLYEKKRTLARSGKPLEVLSVFQRDAFKGYIYMEAKKPEAIERALNGMVNIYAKQRIIVPVSEYPDLLKQVKSSDVEIVPGIYVRITRGKYKGDLAVVDNLSENGLEVRCKVVPRLDYGKNDDFTPEGKRIRSKVRPVPRLFSEQEARMYDGDYLQPGRGPRSYIYRGDEYIEGFLYKDFKLQFIQTKDVHPTLEELDRFQTGNTEEDGMDLAAVAASLKSSRNHEGGRASAFQPGDKVEVRRGEQAKTIGVVMGVSLNEVTMRVTESADPQFVGQEVTVTTSDLRKVFSPGDHVKVVEGKHADQTGLVIKIDGDSVVLLSDQSKEDVRVFANYLIKATDTSSSADMANGQYGIKDLVQLNAQTVGVIVQADKGLFGVLTQDGRVVSVKPTGIAAKLRMTRREQVATDRHGLPIRVGDTVRESGDAKKEGVIVHIHKNTLFIESHELQENLGLFVSSALNVSTIATKNSMVSRTLGPDLSRMNPNIKAAPVPTAGVTRAGGRDKLLYKDVVVNNGNYKGLMGKVVETDDTDARIELHTKAKKIKVNKTKLSVMVRGESVPYLRFIGAQDTRPVGGSGPAFASGARSAWGGATPAAGGATPAVGGASAWGGKTPAAGGASTWGGGGGASAWGGSSAWGNNKGGSSAWGNKGGSPSWGSSGGSSAWGNKGGSSSWGDKGGSSSWGNKGNSSSWGNKGGSSAWGDKGNNSSWGDKGNNSSWGDKGNNSSWGNKSGNNSAWGKSGGSSAWGNQDSKGDSSAWGNSSNKGSSWGNDGGSSAWGNK
ncbi:putative transcription elongation factor [Clavispora lusitaniae]|uniref:Transcription elongation factor SPT5 n=1 Tax=Clavispora lusitaniae TaxID=36911 RepID=A0AA91T4M0_CLALS|nr:putative transcription elongation factor [Clavispora lusitaniae]